jgi:hypothetical protein
MLRAQSFISAFLISISIYFDASAYQYNLTVCAIFQNEAFWLPEWIEFHEKQGVEQFYLYNNLSGDNYKEVLQPYIEKGLVTLIEWPKSSNSISKFNLVQTSAYKDCLKKIASQAKWCAIMDIDEFIFSVDGRPFSEALKQYDKYQAVVVNWVCYGSSGVQKIPEGNRIIDTLLMRAPIDHDNNRFVKSVVKPEFVTNCESPHFCILKSSARAVNENFEFHDSSMRTKKVSVSKLRINHYWSRDLDFFYNVKIDRWIAWGMPYTKAIEKESEMNAEYDDILSKYSF